MQWCDVMEILPGPEHSHGIEVHNSGIPIAGKHADHLCVKAYELLRKNYPVRSVKLYLHKQIPTGAGLGGGSSDAAFFVKQMNQLFSLGITMHEMEEIVRHIGADCAYFIKGHAAFANERGDNLFPLDFSLKGYHIVIVHPGIHVSTATAFADIVPAKSSVDCREVVLNHPVSEWKNLLVNDFEKTVFAAHPEIAEVKRKMYEAGAIYASMSGSGSAVYGLFTQQPDLSLGGQCFAHWEGRIQ